SGQSTSTSLFKGGDEASIKHIDWAQEADAVVIAPATANIIGKFANGIADDALSTFIMAVTCPVMICPSMNTNMYESKAVQRNLETLRNDGFYVLSPGEGDLACGTSGPGRLPEPVEIMDRLLAHLTPKDLLGKKVLVSAGPTHEAIDPVRYISNPSSGKMGYAIARAAENRGADVILVTGPTHLTDPIHVNTIKVRTAAEMADVVCEHFDSVDIAIKAAAVSDYRPREQARQKIKKKAKEMVLSLAQNPDILKTLGKIKTNQILVGFAAETQDLEQNATAKLKEKNLDMIVGNLVGEPDSGFAADTNRVTLFFRDGTREALETMEKDAVAHTLLDRILPLANE
ncbi:MAG: bifunctional phosphopantothenoylcysteine decarboxylase/phosphopantothenate--cysteine ligase CoaBC, partial [Desulfobacterales bacterium]